MRAIYKGKEYPIKKEGGKYYRYSPNADRWLPTEEADLIVIAADSGKESLVSSLVVCQKGKTIIH